MTTALPRPPRDSPLAMTGRARAWMAAEALQSLLLGGTMLFATSSYQSPAFDPIIRVLALQTWGVAFIFIGLNAAAVAVMQHEWWARWTVIISFAVIAMWAAGLFIAAVQGKLQAPAGPIIWTSMAVKDLIVASMPMRSPFERLVISNVEA